MTTLAPHAAPPLASSARAFLRDRCGRWRYASPDKRDLRLDLLRGYLMFAMIVNHIGGESWLLAITGGNRFLVSAAEGFVLVSGLVMGMVYSSVIRRSGLGTAVSKVLRRGAMLYTLHVALTLSFVALSRLLGAPWHTPIEDRLAYLVGVLTLRQTYYLTDVIHLYAVLVLAAPVAIVLLARGQALLVLAGSLVLWAAYQASPELLPSAVASGPFPLAAWQVYFFVGLAIGYHRGRVWAALGHLPASLSVLVLALASAAISAQHISGGTLLPAGTGLAEAYDWAFVKYDARPGRLLAVALLSPLAYVLVTATWRPLLSAVGWLLMPLGQNALVAYSLHLLVVVSAWTWLALVPGFDGSLPAVNALSQLTGVVVVWWTVRNRSLFVRYLVRPQAGSPRPHTPDRRSIPSS